MNYEQAFIHTIKPSTYFGESELRRMIAPPKVSMTPLVINDKIKKVYFDALKEGVFVDYSDYTCKECPKCQELKAPETCADCKENEETIAELRNQIAKLESDLANCRKLNIDTAAKLRERIEIMNGLANKYRNDYAKT
jgi:hypothetical protein